MAAAMSNIATFLVPIPGTEYNSRDMLLRYFGIVNENIDIQYRLLCFHLIYVNDIQSNLY